MSGGHTCTNPDECSSRPALWVTGEGFFHAPSSNRCTAPARSGRFTRGEKPAVAAATAGQARRTPDAPLFDVMEFVDGIALLRFTAVTPRKLERVAAKIQTTHSMGIAHRGLSPRNSMMRHGTEPVVIDWSWGGAPLYPRDAHPSDK